LNAVFFLEFMLQSGCFILVQPFALHSFVERETVEFKDAILNKARRDLLLRLRSLMQT